jgi:hypothetical protein
MNEASNSRDSQPVYEFRVFDGTALEGLPMYLVTIHFTQAARPLMAERGRDVLLEAQKTAKCLVFSLGEPIQGRMEMRDTFADVDTLGPPTGDPDSSGTQAWVSWQERVTWISSANPSGDRPTFRLLSFRTGRRFGYVASIAALSPRENLGPPSRQG